MQQYWVLGALLLVGLVIAAEYARIYRQAKRQEKKQKLRRQTETELDERLSLIFGETGFVEQEERIAGLQEYAAGSAVGMELLCERLLPLTRRQEMPGAQKAVFERIIHAVDPVAYYTGQLKTGDASRKAYVLQKLSDYAGPESIPEIRQFIGSPNRSLSYHAAMTLAALGDGDSLVQFILNCEKERRYSHRIILQVLDTYTGDMTALAGVLLGRGDEYIRTAVIKGVVRHRIREFERIYLRGLDSASVDMRVACLRALGQIADPKYERSIVIGAHDRSWVVRAAAAGELGRFSTETSMQALEEALTDPSWWVRHNAAASLVAVDVGRKHVDAALNKYDKYAAEALRAALQETDGVIKKERVRL